MSLIKLADGTKYSVEGFSGVQKGIVRNQECDVLAFAFMANLQESSALIDVFSDPAKTKSIKFYFPDESPNASDEQLEGVGHEVYEGFTMLGNIVSEEIVITPGSDTQLPEYGRRLTIALAKNNIEVLENDTVKAALSIVANESGAEVDVQELASATSAIAAAIGIQTSPNGDWQPGEYVAVGDRRTYSGQGYVCRLAHVTQADWTPDVVAALWEVERSGGQWQQPAPGTHGYRKGDIVTHGGKTWISDVDYNVWEPGATGVYTWVEVAG